MKQKTTSKSRKRDKLIHIQVKHKTCLSLIQIAIITIRALRLLKVMIRKGISKIHILKRIYKHRK